MKFQTREEVVAHYGHDGTCRPNLKALSLGQGIDEALCGACEAFEVAWEKVRKQQRARAESETVALRTPQKGERVRVYRGKKVPKGTEGVIFWKGEVPRLLESRATQRVGIKDDAGNTHWVSATYLMVECPIFNTWVPAEGVY